MEHLSKPLELTNPFLLSSQISSSLLLLPSLPCLLPSLLVLPSLPSLSLDHSSWLVNTILGECSDCSSISAAVQAPTPSPASFACFLPPPPPMHNSRCQRVSSPIQGALFNSSHPSCTTSCLRPPPPPPPPTTTHPPTPPPPPPPSPPPPSPPPLPPPPSPPAPPPPPPPPPPSLSLFFFLSTLSFFYSQLNNPNHTHSLALLCLHIVII